MQTIPSLKNSTLFAAVLLVGGLLTATPSYAGRGGGGAAGGRGGGPVQGIYKSSVTPHWFHENTCFWYRNNLKGGTKEFIFVNAELGTRQPAFDHAKLAASLSKV